MSSRIRLARVARRAPEDTPCEMIFDDGTEAPHKLMRKRYSPMHLSSDDCVGLPLASGKQLGDIGASLATDGRKEVHVQMRMLHGTPR